MLSAPAPVPSATVSDTEVAPEKPEEGVTETEPLPSALAEDSPVPGAIEDSSPMIGEVPERVRT